MIPSALATLLLALAAMAPGPLLARGQRLDTARLAALATASLAVSMLATALLGAGVYLVSGASLPVWSLLPVSLALAGAALWHTRGQGWHRPSLEWPGLALAALFVAYGAYTYAISFTELPDGALRVHAWYNADWFKHLGHTFALADYGVPARDIFAEGRPLHYYWLFYVLPGAGAALGGDGWAALYTANLVVTALAGLTFYGLLRSFGASPVAAAASVFLATVALAPVQHWWSLFTAGPHALLHAIDPPLGPPYLSFALYIPQHALAIALLLAWATLALGREAATGAVRWAGLAGLASVMAISTLFGAALLGAYGLTELWRRRLAAVPELAIMALLSVGFVIACGVFKLDAPTSALHSSLELGATGGGSALDRAMASVAVIVRNLSVLLPLTVYLLIRWRPADEAERRFRLFAAVLVALTLLAAFASEFASERIAHEMRSRVANMPAVSLGIVCAWALAKLPDLSPRHRAIGWALFALVVLVGVPGSVLRTAWHGNADDGFITVVPGDDRAVLAALRAESAPRDRVWQYPEKPYLAEPAGDDNWSAIFAGRTAIASERATDFPAAAGDIAWAQRYFAGEDLPVPQAAGWVYLSRKLHPETYAQLLEKLDGDPGWQRRACRPDACLFARRTTGD